MNGWIIAGIIGLLLIGVFGANMAFAKEAPNASTIVKSTSGCGSCNGQCSAENNCGLSTCAAASGGTCGCSKK